MVLTVTAGCLIGLISLGGQLWLNELKRQAALDNLSSKSGKRESLGQIVRPVIHVASHILMLVLSVTTLSVVFVLLGVRALLARRLPDGTGFVSSGVAGLVFSLTPLFSDIRQRRIVLSIGTIPLAIGLSAFGASLASNGLADIGIGLILGSSVPTIVLWGTGAWKTR